MSAWLDGAVNGVSLVLVVIGGFILVLSWLDR